MIPQQTTDLILDTVKIEDVVGDFVTLKRRGANFVACCPFHNEKTPSFYVSPSKGIYKCFGCGKAGSAVGFIMEHEHYSYPEALRYLAKRYNIEIVEEEESAEDILQRQRRESLLLVSDFACRFYHDQLSTPEGRAVGYAYLRSRGLEDETIDKFSLGWAPSGRTALIDAALAEGYKMEYLLAAGLAVQQEGGAVVDKFHERVMFPIHSVSGRVVAFSGRTLRSDNPAKYVNTAETEIYVKSRNLLGIWFAKSEISRQHRCILVEGNVDMVTLHQLGIGNVVASCGTSLTVEQIRLIKKFTDDVTIMYDGDSAGIHAAMRGINLILAEGLNVRIVLLPEGEDPDSFGRKHTLEEVQDFIASNEQDFIEFKTKLLLKDAGDDPLKKANLINDIAETISQISDAIKRSVYVDACATLFGIESGIVFERISDLRSKRLQDERLRLQREEHREQQLSPQASENPQSPGYTAGPQFERPALANAEREILDFLLNYGDRTLDFESDSEYWTEEKCTVSEFISSSLAGNSFANSLYGGIYAFFMKELEEGLERTEILRKMYNCPDRELAQEAADISTEKYQLTVKSFASSMTTESSWLVESVPKSIVNYAAKRVQADLGELMNEIKTAPEEKQEEIMARMIKLQATLRKINAKLGRNN